MAFFTNSSLLMSPSPSSSTASLQVKLLRLKKEVEPELTWCRRHKLSPGRHLPLCRPGGIDRSQCLGSHQRRWFHHHRCRTWRKHHINFPTFGIDKTHAVKIQFSLSSGVLSFVTLFALTFHRLSEQLALQQYLQSEYQIYLQKLVETQLSALVFVKNSKIYSTTALFSS